MKITVIAFLLIQCLPIVCQTDFIKIKEENQGRLAQLLERFDQTNDKSNALQLSKEIAVLKYKLGDLKDIDFFHQFADSTSQNSITQLEDWRYGIHRLDYAVHINNTDQAMYWIGQLDDLQNAVSDTTSKIYYYCKKARVYATADDMALALEQVYKASLLNATYKGTIQDAQILSAKSAIEWENRNWNKALDHSLEAINIYREEKQWSNLSTEIKNAIPLAQELNRMVLLDTLYQQSSNLQKVLGCNNCYYSDELNRALFYIQNKKYYESIELLDKMIDYAGNIERDPSHAFYLKGVAYRGLNRYDQAEIMIEKAFEMAKNIAHHGKCAFYSHALYQTYYWKDKYEPALQWHLIHSEYRDSVYNEKKAKDISIFEAKIEALEQKQIAEELKSKTTIQRQENYILWLLLGLITSIGLGVAYFLIQSSRKKQLQHEKALITIKAEKQLLEQELQFKQKELTSQILHMSQKNILLGELKSGIQEILKSYAHPITNSLINKINHSLELEDDWSSFLNVFKSIHSSFLEKLETLSTDLTNNEIRLASLMKMNMTTKEIANILNVTTEGVKKARYRLRKKIDVPSETNLTEYILAL